MRLLRLMIATAALAWSGSASAQPAPPVDYADAANWLCLPGRADVCGAPLPTTALNANGYGAVGRSVPAADAKIDCFYVYPTISLDATPNSDLIAGPEEQGVAATQFARFASVCRPFAPIYRQATLAALRSVMSGKPAGDMGLAYADVLAAWRHYLARDNGGRPFVLIGHSQGTVHLTRLLAEEIETGPAAKQMLSALLIGYNIEVPQGALVGGSFKRTPLCTRVGETGCVVAYVSFPADSPPPPAGPLARAARPGMTVACTNPAGLRAGTTPLDSYWFTGQSTLTSTGPAIAWSSQGAPPTPFVRTEALASAACVNRGPVGYLSVTVNADARDARTDRIPGAVHVAGTRLPGWGLHLGDIDVAQGDLIALVEAQAAAVAR